MRMGVYIQLICVQGQAWSPPPVFRALCGICFPFQSLPLFEYLYHLYPLEQIPALLQIHLGSCLLGFLYNLFVTWDPLSYACSSDAFFLSPFYASAVNLTR